MVPIASFEDSEPAKSLASRLCEEGLGAITDNDAGDQFLRFCTPHPHAQWHVLVPPEEFNQALKRLKDLDGTEQALRFAVRCPDCGSTEIEYPQFSRNTILGAIVPAAAAAIGLVERQFYCTACHFTWSPSDDSEKKVVGKMGQSSIIMGIDMTPPTPSGSVFCDDRGLSTPTAGTGTALQ